MSTSTWQSLDSISSSAQPIHCCTKIQVHELSIQWSIENYSFHDALKYVVHSSLFTSDSNEKYEWSLELAPEDCNDMVNFNLQLSPRSLRQRCSAKYRVAIVDSEGKGVCKQFYDICEFNPKPKFESCGWKPLISREQLFDNRSTLLPNDTLTIFCDIMFSSMDSSSNTVPLFSNSDQQSTNIWGNQLCQDSGALLKTYLAATDVVLIADGKEYPAHKNILAAASPVFAAIFANDTIVQENNRVVIEDIDGEIIENILRFIYTGKCLNLNKLAERLQTAAEKYKLEKLENMCKDEVAKNAPIEKSVPVSRQSSFFLPDSNSQKLKNIREVTFQKKLILR